jgi:hypothetical protein
MQKFSVLFTNQLTKKAKTFRDGFIELQSDTKRVSLFDEEMKFQVGFCLFVCFAMTTAHCPCIV